MSLYSKDRGFSLVELAIVLVLIGLMTGAVLKGQAMINDAKQKRLMNDLQGISAAYFTYFDRYNALPGDDTNSHGWTGITAGSGDSWISGDNTSDGTETHEAWQALRYSGLLTGDPTATGLSHCPGSPYGGKYLLGNRSFGTAVGQKNHIQINNISGPVAEVVDLKFDDGLYNRGTVQSSGDYSRATVDLYYAL